MAAATIKDVAREARVSVATVSRVFNGKGPVRVDTRDRVLAAAAALRYVPHGGARSLITNRTSTVGVVLPDLYGEFFSELIRGLDLAARRGGYHLLVSGSHSDRDELEAALRALRGRVDGLILMSPDLDAATLRANLPDDLPVVLLNCRVAGHRFDTLSVGNVGGAAAMVGHLAGLGHRRIAFVRGAAGNNDAAERLRGFRRAVRRLGLPAAAELELAGDFSEESGYRAGPLVLALDPRPDAVFAANDSMAIGLLAALREAGEEVPEGIALAGFDDIPIARFLTPALTTVRVDIARLGARAFERLAAALDPKGSPPGGSEVVPTQVVVRASCGAAAIRATAIVPLAQTSTAFRPMKLFRRSKS